jgi:RiboL-PSP-HEPN
MPYTSHFSIADDMITHLSSIVGVTSDPFMSSRYVGFVAVSAVTVYELALKEIFIEFAQKKHIVFGTYTKNHFDRINGRIRLNQIKDDYIKKFGQKYLIRYNKKINEIEAHILRTQRISVIASYENLITWRNEFAHEGQIPRNVTFNEVVISYYLGKELIRCVSEAMIR